MSFGEKPYGLREVVIANLDESVVVSLPAAQTLTFKERISSGELKGNDRLQSVVGIVEAIEWELENGGISLAAYAVMTGRTVVTAGTTPSQTRTMNGQGGDLMPYFKIYGKAVGEDTTDDIHCVIYKAKVTDNIEGKMGGDEFLVTKAGGIGVDDGTNGIFDWIQHETAAALPTAT